MSTIDGLNSLTALKAPRYNLSLCEAPEVEEKLVTIDTLEVPSVKPVKTDVSETHASYYAETAHPETAAQISSNTEVLLTPKFTNVSKTDAFQLMQQPNGILSHFQMPDLGTSYNPLPCGEGYVKPTKYLKKVHWEKRISSTEPASKKASDMNL